MSDVNGAATEGKAVLLRAEGLMRSFEQLAAASVEETQRVRMARVADRLAASVLRPLGGALGEPPPAPTAAPASVEELSLAAREPLSTRRVYAYAWAGRRPCWRQPQRCKRCPVS